MRVAARRSTRVGQRSGVPLEDLGVAPDERYHMTRADLLQGNVDLIARAAKILAGKPKQTLQIETIGAAPFGKVVVKATDLDRVDLFVDGRPVATTDLSAAPAAPTTITLPKPVASKKRIAANGYRKSKLVVSARL